MPNAVLNPPNPFDSTRIDWAGDHIDVEPPLAKLEVFEEEARSILAELLASNRWTNRLP